MKTLLLVRHAESDWPESTQDFDRPLSEEGHREARKMAKFLHEKKIMIDAFATSTAKRALTTCRYFAETYGNPQIKKVEDLYEPLQDDFWNTVSACDDAFGSLALFSHNPGISEFASKLCDTPISFPTCGVAVFTIKTGRWKDFRNAEKSLSNFFSPDEINS